MKIVLKIIAVMVGFAVLRTVVIVFRFASTPRLGLLIGSGVFGVATVILWFLTLVAGPVASVQLWRLRRIGLYVAAFLCALALLYYSFGFAFDRGPEGFAPLIAPILGNLGFLALLLSPHSRRVCS